MSWWRRKLHGFYAVLDRDDRDLGIALLGAARVLQVRKKPAGPGELEALATLARQLTAEIGAATLIVNDDLELAEHIGADGVHLGQRDMPLAEARGRTDMIIGVSTHSLEQLDEAVSGGADYVAFGPVFETRTKQNPEPTVGLELLAQAVERAGEVPVVAIGGITGDNIADVAATGVAAACSIGWVNDSKDPAARARQIAEPFGRLRID